MNNSQDKQTQKCITVRIFSYSNYRLDNPLYHLPDAVSLILQWKGVSQRQASSSVINFEALAIGLQRLSALFSKTLAKDGRQANSLNIGTYVLYRVHSETCKVFVL